MYLCISRPPKLDVDELIKKKNAKFKQRLESHERLLRGYANPTLVSATTPTPTEQTTLTEENVEEFRDFGIPANNINEIQYYDDGSGGFTNEDSF